MPELEPNLSGSGAGGCLSSGHPVPGLPSRCREHGMPRSWGHELCVSGGWGGRWCQCQGAAWGWVVASRVTAHTVPVGSHGTRLAQQLLVYHFLHVFPQFPHVTLAHSSKPAAKQVWGD